MQLSDEQIIKFVEGVQRDPIPWIKGVLNFKPWDTQEKIIRSVFQNRYTGVKGCHGMGKSALAASAVISFNQAFPDSIVVTTAPTNRQVKSILWGEINQMWSGATTKLIGECLTQHIKIGGKWYAMGFSPGKHNNSAFQGLHANRILIVLDEAGGLDDALWEGAKSMMSNDNAHLLAIGNPTDPLSYFKTFTEMPNVNTFKVSAFDTPNLRAGRTIIPGLVNKLWIDEVVEEFGIDSPYYISRVEAEFPENSPNALIPLKYIMRAVNVEAKKEGVSVLGVDVAEEGGDETVIYHRVGGWIELRQAYRFRELMETVGTVIDEFKTTGAKIIHIDATGMGSGVYGRLKEQGYPVSAAVAGTSAIQPHSDKIKTVEGKKQPIKTFANARAEWFWNLREMIRNEQIQLPNDKRLIAQLSSLNYTHNSRGEILIESKKKMKESPDRADALAIAFATLENDELGFLRSFE